MKVWQISRNRRIQVQLPCFDELHHSNIGEQF